MTRAEIMEKIQGICKDVFEDEAVVITEETTAADVDGWDSLTHLSLMNELEEAFDVEFMLDEVIGAAKIGDLVDIIEQRIKA